jgi:hypothetical protein
MIQVPQNPPQTHLKNLKRRVAAPENQCSEWPKAHSWVHGNICKWLYINALGINIAPETEKTTKVLTFFGNPLDEWYQLILFSSCEATFQPINH